MALSANYLTMNIQSLIGQNAEWEANLNGWHEVKTQALEHNIDVTVIESNISEIAKQVIKNERLIDVFQQLIEAQR